MIKRFVLAAAATLLAAAPAASAYPQSNLSDGHRDLIEAINRAGVEVVADTALCDEMKAEGYYNGEVVAICFRGRGWEAETLDTLRHEGQHVVQDCHYDGRTDFRFPGRSTLMPDPVSFALSTGMTERQIDGISVTYSQMGADFKEVMMEVEAWATARAIPPEMIADQIDNHCTAAQ